MITKFDKTTRLPFAIYGEFIVYPNPFMSDIKIEISEDYLVERIDVVDTKGKTVVRKNLDNTVKKLFLIFKI